MNKKILAAALAVTLAATAAGFWWSRQATSSAPVSGVPSSAAQSTPEATAAGKADTRLHDEMEAILALHRKIIVLFADEAKQTEAERAAAGTVGQMLFHELLERRNALGEKLAGLGEKAGADERASLELALDYVESAGELYDADRLAFRESLLSLREGLGRSGALPAIKLHKRVSEDLDALDEIERNYEREFGQIFSRFESRAIVPKRERWEDYIAKLNKRYTREQVMKDAGVIVPYPRAKDPGTDANEIFGQELPPKTVMLTFDDGPHPQYSDEIAAILKQYGVPAVFFEVGRNLGTLDAEGKAHPAVRGAAVSQRLKEQGFVIGNHSMTHAQLSKASGEALKQEVQGADSLLLAVNPERSPLFRFPYGARNAEGLALLRQSKLQSMMWNIDSLDWADPLPSSIADRVLRTVDKEKRGIILFHDIHERSVKALPLVLSRLVSEGYQFAIWDKGEFRIVKGKGESQAVVATTGYGDSWAVVIGIDDYAHWPKLQYAARDADAVRSALIERFGFQNDKVISLKNEQATRNGILAAFHERLAHGGLKKNDRVFVFFAGHGATRKLSSGRDLGYIVPVDSDPEQIASDGIPMSDLQNISESLGARHVLFVMDACYSGLGLTRGGGGFLKENARRIGRQMLTAGGADQMVADGGPSGHSVFTWTLLQALAGKGDLNGDGYITATELAAYVAPAVSAISQQTPAFGSLPGSEGGEFVFELPAQTEFLSADSGQLSQEAIATNTRLDAAAAPAAEQSAPVAVVIRDLQGGERRVVPPKAVPGSQRQQAQRANDRGLQFYREKRYEEAEAEFTEALKQQPDFALAANNLGFVYYKQGKFKEAVAWFQNTVKIDPSRAVAYLNLGDAYQRIGDLPSARGAWKTYLELAPDSPNAAKLKAQL
ncbi:polysaccharide deacetylase family protein [Niveibacterium sp. SC-1]|uniref:polysaccharide deacetylase family protein n=1 Tax=Niveibacterium sp. SC-1 TaxID=3135646 RepID=UPI00311D7BD4